MALASRRTALALAAAAALALAGAPAWAQTYPDKGLRIMVGASPGGGTDILARMLAD
jgi:tripartite-type tricarboxylate transporter receptor subunit TctC